MAILGIPDEDFLRGEVPMTKREVRILILANAQLRADAIVYDIGAGTGSLSIEAARQAAEGHVYAIERKPEGVRIIRANAEKFGVQNLTVTEAEAPDGMESLPPADVILIGGSGQKLSPILDAADGKLKAGGRLVLSCITIQTIAQATAYFRAQQTRYLYQTISVQVNRLRQVGPYDMAQAENPIYLLTAEKRAAADE